MKYAQVGFHARKLSLDTSGSRHLMSEYFVLVRFFNKVWIRVCSQLHIHTVSWKMCPVLQPSSEITHRHNSLKLELTVSSLLQNKDTYNVSWANCYLIYACSIPFDDYDIAKWIIHSQDKQLTWPKVHRCMEYGADTISRKFSSANCYF